MKVLILYGNNRKGSTFECVEILKEKLNLLGDYQFVSYHLPKDLPDQCRGCFNCILKGEDKCPDYKYVQRIVEDMVNADGIVISSPVYGLDVSGGMKTFIDHICYMWLAHRPDPKMFDKTGVVVSTAAGIGTKRTNKTMNLALKNLGVNKRFSIGALVAASNWNDVSGKRKQKITKRINNTSKKFDKAMNRKKGKTSFYTKMLMSLMRKMFHSYEDGNVDKEYWRQKGWLDNKRPWKR